MANFVTFIVTGFWAGKIPFAPGTFGSLVAFPLCYIILFLSAYFDARIKILASSSEQEQLFGILAVFIISFILIFFVGKYLSDIYIDRCKIEDPKEIVIDEIAGQMLTIILCSMSPIFVHQSYLKNYLSPDMIDFIFLLLLPFLFFRLFDILKPWPIDLIDQKVKGGLGVMLDDVVAGIFASIICYAITFIIIGS
ncbi:MAG: phosphatidylglycerophosphatase A [Rickettsiaceae bacterium]|nr:phosphatidylglycerophosphatase A [Rickettsiaceae bacterium]